MSERFTQEELEIAKSVDLTEVAAALGYSPRRIGNYYTLKEMDSIRIYNKRHWFRWSRRYEKGENGGSQIDFLRVFAGMDVKSAVFWLLNFSGYRRIPSNDTPVILQHQLTGTESKSEKKQFILPPRSEDNTYLYDYLSKNRGISKSVIDYFVSGELLYESSNYHNIVFLGKDVNGSTKFASLRGVFDSSGKSFKCDVAGNDKNYGFNVWNEESTELVVFEAVIDLMSYTDMFNDFESNKLALGMLYDAPLVTFLSEHPSIQTIKFCLDNDKWGREAAEKFMKKYYELGYEVEDFPPAPGYKDYNEWLTSIKQGLECDAANRQCTEQRR